VCRQRVPSALGVQLALLPGESGMQTSTSAAHPRDGQERRHAQRVQRALALAPLLARERRLALGRQPRGQRGALRVALHLL
jgi:hypothetical protein